MSVGKNHQITSYPLRKHLSYKKQAKAGRSYTKSYTNRPEDIPKRHFNKNHKPKFILRQNFVFNYIYLLTIIAAWAEYRILYKHLNTTTPIYVSTTYTSIRNESKRLLDRTGYLNLHNNNVNNFTPQLYFAKTSRKSLE